LQKNNSKIGTVQKTLFHHEEWLTLKIYLDKKKKYINTFDGYIRKWGKDDTDVRKQFGLGYRYVGVFCENGKWKKLFRHPILALGMHFLKGLVGIIYMTSSQSK